MGLSKSINKVFIIDDEEAICLLLSSLLKKEQIETAYSTSLKEAFPAVTQFKPDVVFLDLSLKDGSGFSIIPRLQEELDTYIIVISAHSGKAEVDQAKQLGVKLFLPKPLNRELILKSLEQID